MKKSITPKSIVPAIRRYLKTIPQSNSTIEVGFFGGSFTGLPHPQQGAYLKEVQPFIMKGKIRGIRVSTRPDFINKDVLNLLKEYRVSCVELGVQSTLDDVLKASKRGHTRKDIEKASEMILEKNFVLGHQIMVGLPKSTLAKELKTAKMSVAMGASQIRIYPVVVIKGTELGDMYKRGLYTPLDESDAIRRCACLVRFFEKNGAKVIRCGLHPSMGLITGKDLLEGPFHPAFRQKVETYLYSDIFKKYRGQLKSIKRILYNTREEAAVIGHKRVNAAYVESITGRRDIFKPAASILPGKLKFEFENGRYKFISKVPHQKTH